jgi:hypothetical protein
MQYHINTSSAIFIINSILPPSLLLIIKYQSYRYRYPPNKFNFCTMKFSVVTAATAAIVCSSVSAFVPTNLQPSTHHYLTTKLHSTTVKKPTGTSFLPKETVERCEKGNPTEKVKLAVDPVNAWVDIYEYARKIREGEMTWKDMEKADIDTVSFILFLYTITFTVYIEILSCVV